MNTLDLFAALDVRPRAEVAAEAAPTITRKRTPKPTRKQRKAKMPNVVKRGRGRPSLSGETGERFQVTIPPTVAARLRTLGDGSLSQGIIRAAELAPKRRTRA